MNPCVFFGQFLLLPFMVTLWKRRQQSLENAASLGLIYKWVQDKRPAPVCFPAGFQKQTSLIWFVSERQRRLWIIRDRVTPLKLSCPCLLRPLPEKEQSWQRVEKSNLPCGFTSVSLRELKITHNSLGLLSRSMDGRNGNITLGCHKKGL